jgi:hypothetical protein
VLWGMPLGKLFEHYQKLPEDVGTGMCEFTMVNSSAAVHIMMQFLLTRGHKNICLHEANIVHHNSFKHMFKMNIYMMSI